MVVHVVISTTGEMCKMGGSESRLTWAKMKPYFQNNQGKKIWSCGSSGRVPASEV
jgi:hypothetical protein